jgi:hypothetical protein
MSKLSPEEKKRIKLTVTHGLDSFCIVDLIKTVDNAISWLKSNKDVEAKEIYRTYFDNASEYIEDKLKNREDKKYNIPHIKRGLILLMSLADAPNLNGENKIELERRAESYIQKYLEYSKK